MKRSGQTLSFKKLFKLMSKPFELATGWDDENRLATEI